MIVAASKPNGLDAVFYAQARIWKFAVWAACGPRGEQWKRALPCLIVLRLGSHCGGRE